MIRMLRSDASRSYSHILLSLHHLPSIKGALMGLLALFVHLKNAELVLHKWTYQRGYRGVESLLQDVLTHWSSQLQAQLPRILMHSVGPMHEVTNIG